MAREWANTVMRKDEEYAGMDDAISERCDNAREINGENNPVEYKNSHYTTTDNDNTNSKHWGVSSAATRGALFAGEGRNVEGAEIVDVRVL
eukprot:gene26372-32346_t